VTLLDLLLVGWVLLFALSGYFRGFTTQVVSLLGVVAGIALGAWLAPKLLSGDSSEWVPLAALVGAAAGAFLAGIAAGRLAGVVHGTLGAAPGFRLADQIGGVAVGGLIGLALAWAAAVLLLHQPALGLRSAVQRSAILPALVRAVPPEPVLRTLERLDPLPVLQLEPGSLPEPDRSVLRSGVARRVAPSVVRVEGTSCGLGIRGSGWVVRRGLVATNAHVVSGQHDTQVLVPDVGRRDATIVYLDARNDVALLRVGGLGARPLRASGEGEYPRQVLFMGYPLGGALVATPGTAGAPRTVLAPDAYDRSIRPRQVVPLRGRVRRGESGGPVLDAGGTVVAMVFGGSRGGNGGFAVPVEIVLRAADGRLRPVDVGPCVG
jgi:S1-C subfamily serine protease